MSRRKAEQGQAEVRCIDGMPFPVGTRQCEQGTGEQHRSWNQPWIEECEQRHGKQGEPDADRRLQRGGDQHDRVRCHHGR